MFWIEPPTNNRIVVIFSYQKYFFILQGISKWWWSTFLCNWRKIPEVLYFVVYFMVEKISLCFGLYGFIFFYFIESIQWGQCCAFVKRGDRYRLDICKKKKHIKHNKYIHVTIFYFYLCFARIVIVDSIDLT